MFGNFGLNKGVGRVSYAAAGRDMTVAVIRANSDPRDVESAYRRAAYVKSHFHTILTIPNTHIQYPTLTYPTQQYQPPIPKPNTHAPPIQCTYRYSDAGNADILRQLETFALEYDKFGRGEVLQKSCDICKGDIRCEACDLFEVYAGMCFVYLYMCVYVCVYAGKT